MSEGIAGESSRHHARGPLHEAVLNRLARGDSLGEIIQEVVLQSETIAAHVEYRASVIAEVVHGTIQNCRSELKALLWERLRRKDYLEGTFCLDRVIFKEITFASIEVIRRFAGRRPRSQTAKLQPVVDIDEVREDVLSYRPENVFERDDFLDCVRRQIATFPRPIARILTLRLLHEEPVQAIARKVRRSKSRISQVVNDNMPALRSLVAKMCLGTTDV